MLLPVPRIFDGVVAQIADVPVPVPRIMEEIVQIMDVPVPQFQEHTSERIAEQMDELPVPQDMDAGAQRTLEYVTLGVFQEVDTAVTEKDEGSHERVCGVCGTVREGDTDVRSPDA